MKKIVFVFLLICPLCIKAQKAIDKFGVDTSLGITTDCFLACNVGVSINNWIWYLNLQMKINSPTKGIRYTGLINSENFSSEVRGKGDFYDGIYGVGLGYFFTKDFEMGMSIGYACNRKYENRYDKDHILSKSGPYYIDSSNGGRVSTCAHISYYFKRSTFGRPFVRLAYDNCSKLAFIGGFNINII